MTRARRLVAGTVLAVSVGGGVAVSVAALAAPAQAATTTSVSYATSSYDTSVRTQVRSAPGTPTAPVQPTSPAAPTSGGTVTVDINGVNGKPSSSVAVILAVTLLSVAPALLLMTTSFTKIVVVLGLTRNALGLQGTPPNQVLVGLAMFLSLFVMGPVLAQVNSQGVQPYLKGTMTASQAFDAGSKPLKTFMLDHTRKEELALITKAADRELPATRDDVPLTTLIPAFMLSELKAAFIIGFVIFVPFLVIDIVVSATLMSLGMMMLPPVMVSLPFKLLLFVLVDGWGLVVTSLVQSYR